MSRIQTVFADPVFNPVDFVGNVVAVVTIRRFQITVVAAEIIIIAVIEIIDESGIGVCHLHTAVIPCSIVCCVILKCCDYTAGCIRPPCKYKAGECRSFRFRGICVHVFIRQYRNAVGDCELLIVQGAAVQVKTDRG